MSLFCGQRTWTPVVVDNGNISHSELTGDQSMLITSIKYLAWTCTSRNESRLSSHQMLAVDDHFIKYCIISDLKF